MCVVGVWGEVSGGGVGRGGEGGELYQYSCKTWPKKKLQSSSLVTTVACARPVLLVTCRGVSLMKMLRDRDEER